jgi:PAS domain-containing protein
VGFSRLRPRSDGRKITRWRFNSVSRIPQTQASYSNGILMLRIASEPVGRLLGRMGHPHSLVASPASSFASYLIALLFGVLALAIRGLLGSVTDLVFVTFYPAVLAAAWWCGLGPALLTTAVCALGGDFYSLLPRQHAPFDTRVLTNVTVFIALCIFGAVLTTKFRNGQRQLASVLDAMGDGVLTLDREWRFTYVNRRYTELVARDAAALLGGVLWELFPGADARPIGQAFRRAMADGSPANVVSLSPALHKWIEADIYPRPQGLTVFVRDVTGRVEAEHQRAVELAALQNARVEMERISRLKDEFLATVSHELRTPLNAVAGWSQVLAHGTSLPPDAAAATQRIQRSAALLTKLVDDLLDVARVARGPDPSLGACPRQRACCGRRKGTQCRSHELRRAAVGPRGRGSASAGDRQSPLERGEVHSRRRHRVRRAAPRGRRGKAGGARHWRGDRSSVPATGLRALLSVG